MKIFGAHIQSLTNKREDLDHSHPISHRIERQEMCLIELQNMDKCITDLC